MSEDNLLAQATCVVVITNNGTAALNVSVRDVNVGLKVGDVCTLETSDCQKQVYTVGEVYNAETDMDNADEPYKPTENESFLAGVLGIDYRLYSIGAVDLYFVAACEILRLRGAPALDTTPASEKTAPDPKPEPSHRAPDVWARIRSLNAI